MDSMQMLRKHTNYVVLQSEIWGKGLGGERSVGFKINWYHIQRPREWNDVDINYGD